MTVNPLLTPQPTKAREYAELAPKLDVPERGNPPYHDIRTATWLRLKQLAVGKSRKLVWILLLGWLLLSGLLVAGSFLVWSQGASIASGNVTPLLLPLWLLWAFLPALGGGGDIDSPSQTGPQPIRPSFALATTATGAALDLQYLLPAPTLLAAGIASWGPWSLPATLAFIFGAGATGQLAAWLSIMFGARKAVIATIVSLLFVTLLGMAVLAAGTPLNPGGPPHWYTLANEAALSGNWYVWLGNLAILLVPVAFYLAFAPAIARKALVNRTEPYIKKERTSYTPKSPLLALASAHFKGTTRSLTARVTLITTLAIPVIAKFTIHGASLEQTLIITLLAAGATTAVNSYAYDDTGTLMALSSPMKHREILLARTLATGLWVLTLAIPTTVGSLILGIRPSNGWGTFLLLVVLLVLVVVASGLMPTTKRPTATDHDSIRARPAPVPSTLGYALRAGLLVVTVVPLSVAGGDNGWVGIALVLGYVIFAYSRANHTAKDGAALTAAFRQ